MNEQITSAAELDALPVGSVVMEGASGEPFEWVVPGVQVMPGVFHRFPDGWYVVSGNGQRDPLFGLGFLTVLYRPDQPQRVQPSREDVADTLIQARSSGMCHFGKVCDLCDCGLEGHTDDEARRADARTLIEADAVLALFAQQPTVAEVKAEALREAADDYGINLTVATGPQIRAWLRARADRIEREARP